MSSRIHAIAILSVILCVSGGALIGPLTASDSEQTTTYSVTYLGNGGTPVKAISYVVEGAQVDLNPIATWKDHVFIGWGLEKDGEPLASLAAHKDITLYALWTDGSAQSRQYTAPTDYDDTEIVYSLGTTGQVFQLIPYMVMVVTILLGGWYVYANFKY